MFRSKKARKYHCRLAILGVASLYFHLNFLPVTAATIQSTAVLNDIEKGSDNILGEIVKIKEDSNMTITNLCDYELSDYENIKPIIEGMFVGATNSNIIGEILKTIINIKIGNIIPLLKIENGRFVTENGITATNERQFVYSGENIYGGNVICEKEYNNKNVWNFIFHEGIEGNIINFDFYVTVEDENFAKVNIPLNIQYFTGSRNFQSAIYSIIRQKNILTNDLENYLNMAGFSVRIIENKLNGNIDYYISGENIRHWNSLVAVPGGSNGIVEAHIAVNSDGEYVDLLSD